MAVIVIHPAIGLMIRRLRARRGEIVPAVFAHVRSVAPDPVGVEDVEYVEGLRAAVRAAVEYGLDGIEREWECAEPIPATVTAQARRAARRGVSLEIVLRRYTAGYALLEEFIVDEVENSALSEEPGALRHVLKTYASALERITCAVAEEHGRELERVRRSPAHCRFELVRRLLAGDPVDIAGLGYEFDAEHVGVIVSGAGAQDALVSLARSLGRRLLSVVHAEGTVWGWLGGRDSFAMSDLARVVTTQAPRVGRPPGATGPSADVWFVAGEPGWGLEGWRTTHRQAQAALSVAVHRPQRLTCYADVALLAAVLRDDVSAKSLANVYLSPLGDHRNGGSALRQTLRAYLAAERNASSAASALGLSRHTVEKRLRRIEERLGGTIHSRAVELEVALRLEELHGLRHDWDTRAGL